MQMGAKAAKRAVMCGVAWLGLCALASGCGGRLEIVHSLTELEANEILVILEARDISGSKVREEGRVVTWAVEVPEVDARDAMRFLVANRLPRAQSQGLREVYPPGGGGLIPTKSEERAKFLMAMQGELERGLKGMPGIVQAHVSIVQPEKDVVRDLDTPPPPSTASVAIVYNAIDAQGTAAVKEEEVKSFVAAAVEDLKPANVTVIMKRNVPVTLVNELADRGDSEAPVAAVKQFGLRFVDRKDAVRLLAYSGIALVIALLCLGVGVGGIVRSMSLSRKLAKSDADLAAFRKARQGTQTGLQPQ